MKPRLLYMLKSNQKLLNRIFLITGIVLTALTTANYSTAQSNGFANPQICGYRFTGSIIYIISGGTISPNDLQAVYCNPTVQCPCGIKPKPSPTPLPSATTTTITISTTTTTRLPLPWGKGLYVS